MSFEVLFLHACSNLSSHTRALIYEQLLVFSSEQIEKKKQKKSEEKRPRPE